MEIPFASVFVATVIGFTAIRLIWLGVQWRRSRNMPKVSVEAHVIKVRDKTGTFVREGRHRAVYNFSPGYKVRFETLPNGKKRWFFIPVKQGAVTEGDKGILITQGIRFIRFEKRKSSLI